MINAINWFEIPVSDFARAKKIYETLFDAEIMEMPFPGGKYGMLPSDMEKGVGGGIVQLLGDSRRPFDAQRCDIRGVPEAEVGQQAVLSDQGVFATNLAHLRDGLAVDGCLRPDPGADARPV